MLIVGGIDAGDDNDDDNDSVNRAILQFQKKKMIIFNFLFNINLQLSNIIPDRFEL